MIRVIDKHGEHVVQKVTKPNGEVIRYQVGIPGDFGLMHEFSTLTEAREFIGKGNGK